MTLILWLSACTAVAMVIHEMGHLYAARACGVTASELGIGLGPKLFGLRIGGVSFSLRALPLGSFVRLNGLELRGRPIAQQIFVHLAGVAVNLAAAAVFFGTHLGWINLLLALANLLPIYQHDGWKCGVVLMRALVGRPSRPVEWVFTFSGGVATLVILQAALRWYNLI